MDEIIQLITKTYGIVGVLIIAPMAACVVLFRQNQELHKESVKKEESCTKNIESANERVIKAQEQRVTDAQNVANRLITMAGEQAALVKENNLALEEVQKLLSEVQMKNFAGKRGG